MWRHSVHTFEIELQERVEGLERDWLIGRLLAQRGVRGAAYSERESRRLFVQYDAGVVNGAEIMTHLYVCGLWCRRVPGAGDATVVELVR